MNNLRLVSLISGGGTTMESVGQAIQSGELKGVELVGVIASKETAAGLTKAERLGIPTFVVDRKICKEQGRFQLELLRVLDRLEPDLISQNGWLPLTPREIVEKYRTINQHPGQLDSENTPKTEERMVPHDFGGKGMYGSTVTCARLAYGWFTKEQEGITASTIHHVTADEKLDAGGVIRELPLDISNYLAAYHFSQEEITGVPVLGKLLMRITMEVQKLLLPLEHENVKTVLRSFAEGTVPQMRRTSPLIPLESRGQLAQAKQLARKLFPTG